MLLGVARPIFKGRKKKTPIFLRMEAKMNNCNNTLVGIRQILMLAQYIFSLILLVLEIYERFQHLHLF